MTFAIRLAILPLILTRKEVGSVMREILLYPAALFGGVVLTTIVWIGIVYFWYRSFPQGSAVAGGWTYLLNTPWVVVLLTLGFGLGFYLVTLISRHI